MRVTIRARAAEKPSTNAHTTTQAPGVTIMPICAIAISAAEPMKPARPVSKRSQIATAGAVSSCAALSIASVGVMSSCLPVWSR